jgi:nucleoside-triphosphatase
MATCLQNNFKHVLLTGPPGVGKTTLIQKICAELKRREVAVKGFFTEECRGDGHQRVGFDIVSLDGQRAPLARTGDAASRCTSFVGKYGVLVSSFEQVALPLLTVDAVADAAHFPVIVIDEIGKMELFSDRFTKAVTHLLGDKRVTVLATIPVRRNPDIHFVEQIRRRNDIRLFEISRENRSRILHEVIEAVLVTRKGVEQPAQAVVGQQRDV